MQEIRSDMWKTIFKPDAIVITTNGVVRKDGLAVMGRGTALAGAARFPGLQKHLGSMIKQFGNHVYVYSGANWSGLGQWSLYREENQPKYVICFPTKEDYSDDAKTTLIERSAQELAIIARAFDLKSIVLPRVGCGEGKLEWIDVKPILEKYLDDRFYVVEAPKAIQ